MAARLCKSVYTSYFRPYFGDRPYFRDRPYLRDTSEAALDIFSSAYQALSFVSQTMADIYTRYEPHIQPYITTTSKSAFALVVTDPIRASKAVFNIFTACINSQQPQTPIALLENSPPLSSPYSNTLPVSSPLPESLTLSPYKPLEPTFVPTTKKLSVLQIHSRILFWGPFNLIMTLFSTLHNGPKLLVKGVKSLLGSSSKAISYSPSPVTPTSKRTASMPDPGPVTFPPLKALQQDVSSDDYTFKHWTQDHAPLLNKIIPHGEEKDPAQIGKMFLLFTIILPVCLLILDGVFQTIAGLNRLDKQIKKESDTIEHQLHSESRTSD